MAGVWGLGRSGGGRIRQSVVLGLAVAVTASVCALAPVAAAQQPGGGSVGR